MNICAPASRSCQYARISAPSALSHSRLRALPEREVACLPHLGQRGLTAGDPGRVELGEVAYPHAH
ncbi:hypothetical protein ACFQZ4_05505 [Catellatospora coxensis]